MQAAESSKNADSRTGTDQDQEEEQPVSRIVAEFAGVGMADVAHAEFENVSLGQIMAFAQWAQWQADRAIAQFEEARRRESAKQAGKLVLPKGMGLVQ